MYESSGQFLLFIFCFIFGIFFGVLYAVIKSFKNKIKKNYISIILDLIFFVFISFCFLNFTKNANFPSVRFYMPLSVMLGVYCAVKIFSITLAKIVKKIYNISIKEPRKNYERR